MALDLIKIKTKLIAQLTLLNKLEQLKAELERVEKIPHFQNNNHEHQRALSAEVLKNQIFDAERDLERML